MTLVEQLSCVEREIVRRIECHGFDKSVVGRQQSEDLDCMRAVAETLRGLIDEVNMNEERLP